jgi:hypothetical protein
MLLDCDDPLAVHKFCSMLPAFEFEARTVIPVMDAEALNSKQSPSETISSDRVDCQHAPFALVLGLSALRQGVAGL